MKCTGNTKAQEVTQKTVQMYDIKTKDCGQNKSKVIKCQYPQNNLC
jgi:hypothetical protein